MGAGGRFNKYIMAGACGIAALIIYAVISLNRPGNPPFDSAAAAGVTLATFGVIMCLFLGIDICRHSAADLGKLHEERTTLIGGLLYTFVLSIGAIYGYFRELQHAPPDGDSSAWIYRTWGEARDCSTPITIRRGASERELIFDVGGGSYVHSIIGPPRQNVVQTDQGIYTLQPDGSMSTTEQGMENVRLMPCAQ